MKILNLLLLSILTISVSAQIVKGDTITDGRNGEKYPTLLINGIQWMTKNMNVGVMVQNTNQSNNGIIEKTAYNNDSTNLDVFGGLYTYGEAMQYNESNPQGICPDCWHVATKEEWEALYKLVGDNENLMQNLKISKTQFPYWDGNNTTGFNAVPAGLAYDNVFGRKGDWAIFWTSTPADKNYAWSVEMDNYYQVLGKFSDMKMTNTYLVKNAFSVRCVKNK